MRSLRLDDRLTVEVQPEPVEVFQNSVDKFRTAATGIEILDAQKPVPPGSMRRFVADNRRKCVAEVKAPGRGGSET